MSESVALEKVFPEDLKTLIKTTVVEVGGLHLRVDWIAWNSGFRDSGLAVGDRIVGWQGKLLEFPAEDRHPAVDQARPGVVGERRNGVDEPRAVGSDRRHDQIAGEQQLDLARTRLQFARERRQDRVDETDAHE